MRETCIQECPLCRSSAEYYLVDYDKCKFFKCPRCGLFQVSLRAEGALLQGPQQWRDAYSQKAKEAPEDHALAIRVSSPSQGAGVADAAVAGKYVRMAELPQG